VRRDEVSQSTEQPRVFVRSVVVVVVLAGVVIVFDGPVVVAVIMIVYVGIVYVGIVYVGIMVVLASGLLLLVRHSGDRPTAPGQAARAA
jgi:hypothetical protein